MSTKPAGDPLAIERPDPLVGQHWSDGPAERLDKLLDQAGISNTQLADELGMTDGAISRYRSGERVPNAERLAYMLRRAGASADQVLGIGAHESLLERLKRKIVAEIDVEIHDARVRVVPEESGNKI